MVNGEISESAKAIQEVAKTTKAGIEATEKLGGFVSRIIGEPADAVVGILMDKLKFMRWERQIRLTDRANEIIKSKNIEGELRAVPPKIALPIVENASLEENDELQDLWANLIASSVDPKFDGALRVAFIDIIKQLEVTDVHILNLIYDIYEESNKNYIDSVQSVQNSDVIVKNLDTNICKVTEKLILDTIGISDDLYKESIDNLIRVRCVSSFIDRQTERIPVDRGSNLFGRSADFLGSTGSTKRISFNVTHEYDEVCITPLGLIFARACLNQKTNIENLSENAETSVNE